jgi:uncharacterized membrane protein
MKYQNNNTFRMTLIYFVILFLGIICVPTAHAQNENYSFVTQWSVKDSRYYEGIALDSSGNIIFMHSEDYDDYSGAIAPMPMMFGSALVDMAVNLLLSTVNRLV